MKTQERHFLSPGFLIYAELNFIFDGLMKLGVKILLIRKNRFF